MLNFKYLLTNKTATNVLSSFITVAVISTLCGVAAFFLEKSFWAAFCVATALQYLIGYVVASFTYSDYKKTAYLAELDKLEKLSTILNCAYCNKPNAITFLPDEVPLLECDSCKSVSSVKLSFTVARQTTTAAIALNTNILSEPIKNHNIKL